MAEVIELDQIKDDPVQIEAAVEQVVAALGNSQIIVAAIEHSYVYACDAFDRDAVLRLHTLRGDDFGVAAQVMIGNVQTLEGIAQDVSEDISTLVARFWPGLLTLNMQPHSGLNWDLGDAQVLGEFAVRIPNRDFFRRVLQKSGPLAVSSAALAGRPPMLSIGGIAALYSDIGIYIDEGTLVSGPASTVIRHKVIGMDGGLEVSREGAISLAELQEVLPSITSSTE